MFNERFMFPTVNYAFCSDSPGIQIMIYYDCVGLLASAVKQPGDLVT